MNLSNLKPKTPRRYGKHIGRGGKKGTTSGKGTKGQKARAGAGIKPGFRGGMKRVWQQYPKLRGAKSKPGNKKPHRKHRFYQLRSKKISILNISDFNKFKNGQVVTPELVLEMGLVDTIKNGVKVLGDGELNRKLEFKGFDFSASAKEKVTKSGSSLST